MVQLLAQNGQSFNQVKLRRTDNMFLKSGFDGDLVSHL